MTHSQSDQIDAVITWVNGNDPDHEQKRLKALQGATACSSGKIPTGRHKTRFIDNGELRFCIRSIRKFAPWIKNIYLVTDNQTPDFLTDEVKSKYNITVVDHRDIFRSYEDVLPTFNSRTIETAIWRIPGLAEKFIYFNDDFFLTAPLKKEHFFNNGKVVIRGKWRRIENYGKWRMKYSRIYSKMVKKLLGVTHSMHLLYQIRSAKLVGFKKQYFYVPHIPHPVQKSTLVNFFKKNPEPFEKNIQYKFRNTDQFSAFYLAYHLEIIKNNAELRSPDKAVMINGEMDISNTIGRKIKAIEGGETDFLCIQGLEKINSTQKKHLTKTLSALTEID